MVLPGLSATAAELQYKAVAGLDASPRQVGGEQVGDITAFGLKLFATDPRTHSMLFGFQYKEYDNNVPESAGLALTKHEFAAGVSLQFSRPLSLKVAYTQAEYMNDDPYSAFGLYPCYRGGDRGLDAGLERDLAGTTFTFLQAKLNRGHGTWYGNGSYERFLTTGHGSSAEAESFERIGGGYLYSVPDTRFRLLAGANYNFTEAKPTWIFGASHHTNSGSSGVNPALSVFYRLKPNSRYALGILALWADFGQHATLGIHEAALRGGLKRTQIIAGRNMGDPGIGSAYDASDFGLITFAASLMSVDAGDATLIENDLTGYATYPGSILGVARPYIGATWVESSDLIYDPSLHSLTDPEQSRTEFKLGAKIPVGTVNPDDRNYETGYLRVELVVNNIGGGSIKFQHWF